MSLEQTGSRMGSTAVSLQISKSSAEIHWIGDSRAYLWRSRRLKQVTRDHSFVQELVDAGALTQAEAELHPNRNVVTRAIGVRDSDSINVDSLSLKLWPGDRIVLCPTASAASCRKRGSPRFSTGTRHRPTPPAD